MYHRSKTYRFIALVLAFLMLGASGSWAIDVHYCQGKLVSFSIFGRAKTCHKERHKAVVSPEEENCHHHCDGPGSEKACDFSFDQEDNCCHNQTFFFQSDQTQQMLSTPELKAVSAKVTPHFFIAYIITFFGYDFSSQRDAFSDIQYSPPLTVRDIPVLFQSFLF